MNPFLVTSFLFAALIGLAVYLRLGGRGRGMVSGMVAITLIATCLATTFTFISASGLLASDPSVQMAMDLARNQAIRTISISQARQLRDQDKPVRFVDARPFDDFAKLHIQNAIHLNPGLLDDVRRLRTQSLDRDTTLIVYCSNVACRLDRATAVQLIRDGFTDVRVLDGGFEAWLANYHETDSLEVSP